MRPLYLVGTQRNAGKTTMSIGLVGAFRRRGLDVGYVKPLGQRVQSLRGEYLHDDALVVSKVMGLTAEESTRMTVPLVHGQVEREIRERRVEELTRQVTETVGRLAERHDVVIVEGMGHVAAGACLGLSAPEVARAVGARTMIVGGGGIGRAIDEIALCSTYMTARGAEMVGAVINKIWPEKYDRVKEATAAGLANLHLRCLGAVPYERTLASPTMRQVAQQLNCQVLCGQEALDRRVLKTIVAAMEARHMIAYVGGQAMVIAPGDRSDNLLAIISAHLLDGGQTPAVAGVLLTGGLEPDEQVLELLRQSGLPVLLCKEDTYTLTSRLWDMLFKITPEDSERIEGAMRVVDRYVDVDAILKSLEQ